MDEDDITTCSLTMALTGPLSQFKPEFRPYQLDILTPSGVKFFKTWRYCKVHSHKVETSFWLFDTLLCANRAEKFHAIQESSHAHVNLHWDRDG